MTVSLTTWEHDLLSLALSVAPTCVETDVTATLDDNLLHVAYQYCEQLTAHHSRSFYMASRFLPPEKRLACRALYAFCRISDDIVDNPIGDPALALDKWREQALSQQLSVHHPVALAFHDTRRRYHIPDGYAEQLIQGVASDLRQRRYENFEELSHYCYGVASTVGLMSMHIIGFASEEAIAYAVKLGIALQMTNILRDVAEDWRTGRLYLPQDELAQFDLASADVANGLADGIVTEKWRAFMRFQIERTELLYEEAKPGIAMLHADGRFAITTASELYRKILRDIEIHDYNVFTRRAHVSTGKKLRHLPAIWWQSR